MLLILALAGLGACAEGHASDAQVALNAGGSMIRRHIASEQDGIAVGLTQSERRYGVGDSSERAAKVAHGTASKGSPWKINVNQQQAAKTKDFHQAPPWSPHASMPAMPSCKSDVGQDMGLSDYGSMQHSCTSCQRNCSETNKQQATNLTWLFEPSLATCNAFDVKLYSNWSNIDGLGCKDCDGKGLRHKFEATIATNAGEGLTGYEDKVLGFETWFGPEVAGGPRASGSDFSGHHVLEVWDTEEPTRNPDCDEKKVKNPAGRWLAIPGGLKAGETFRCERVCKPGFPCSCGRNTGMRCTAAIAMSSNQLFAYRLRRVADTATGTLEGNSYVGTEWEVTAEDLSQSSPIMVVGRVILAGNSAVYGIKSMRQSHQHIGCVPCDLFYESTIISGPFIQEPVGVHAVRSADGTPPPLTSESCELFRISSIGGFAVQFETGPGLWPPFEVNDTIFTCSHTGKNTCPA